jgi:cephalosporin hydroxylase
MNKITLVSSKPFATERADRIFSYSSKNLWRTMSHEWLCKAFENKYMYNFEWLDRPIIQTPIDIVAMQEIIWQVKPNLIIETGIAHGGSLVFYASMLALLDMAEAIESGITVFDPQGSNRKVLGVDIDIRAHNRAALDAHPMRSRIQMIEGSSIDLDVIEQVYGMAKKYKKVMVCFDSMHTHEHVLAELEAYAPLVSPESYCVVFDTIVEDLPREMFPDRPWGPGNNPKTAVWEYLRRLKEQGRIAADGAPLHFEINKMIENKLLITVAPDGYLRRKE